MRLTKQMLIMMAAPLAGVTASGGLFTRLSSVWVGGRRLACNLAVASASMLLVLSAVSYVFASSTEALAAIVSSVSSPHGHESIEGRIQGAPAGHVTIRVIAQRGHKRVVRTVRVGRGGHFDVSVAPGHYTLVISDGSKHVSEHLTVRSHRSEFVVVKVTHTSGGFGIAPVIFNY